MKSLDQILNNLQCSEELDNCGVGTGLVSLESVKKLLIEAYDSGHDDGYNEAWVAAYYEGK